ncbi:MAG: hypothetical protein JWM68_1572 [Verrucomicrobiales bacterium]|nr:hypothetical protein [Verrucomicrobiales bacterium]
MTTKSGTAAAQFTFRNLCFHLARTLRLAVVIALVAFGPVAAKCALVIPTTDRGSYDCFGLHYPEYLTYAVGQEGAPFIYRNWFVFNIPALTKKVVSAQLRLEFFSSSSAAGVETYRLYDVTTPISILRQGGSELTNVYNDLGSGLIYGERNVPVSDEGGPLTINLNANFLAALSQAQGTLALGGAITTLDPTFAAPENLFNYSDDKASSVALVLNFDLEPPTIWSVSPTNQFAVAGSRAAFTVSASGSPDLHYQWYHNGSLLAGETNSTVFLPKLSVGSAGNYNVAVKNIYGSVMSHPAALKVVVPDANDRFTNRVVLTGTSVMATATNVAGTREAGEPQHDFYARGASRWWSWTAPADGKLEVNFYDDGPYSVLAIYTGDSVSSLHFLTMTKTGNSEYLPVTAGTEYQLAMDSCVPVSIRGVSSFQLNFKTSPVNDSFDDRLLLAGNNLITTGSTIGATREANEPSGNDASVWWAWTAPANGVVHIKGGLFNSVPLSVFTGDSVGTLISTPLDASSFDGVQFRAIAGTTYQIRATTRNGWSEQGFSLSLDLFLPPTNDLFENAIVLEGTNATTTGTTRGASREAGEPAHANRTNGSSAWWRWTAPANGYATVSSSNTYSPPSFAVYTGDTVSALTSIANAIYGQNGETFPVVAGTVYQIAVDSSKGSEKDLILQITFRVPPTNDMFSDRIILSGSNLVTAATSIGATSEPGEPTHAYFALGRSLWWTWTAPANGRLSIATSATSLVTGERITSVLALYQGTNVASLTRTPPLPYYSYYSSSAALTVKAGAVYQIAVEVGYETGADISLRLDFAPATQNDMFADRIPLSGTNISIIGSNVGASVEPGELDANLRGANSAWWTWTAPETGSVRLTTSGDSFSTVAGAYTGDAVNSLSRVAFGDSTIFFDVAKGTTYQIAVSGQYSGDEGSLSIQLTLALPPSNDLFANRTPLAGTNISVAGTTLGATREVNEPLHAWWSNENSHSVWWTWTAPTNGTAEIKVDLVNWGQLLTVYTGETISSLTRIAGADGTIRFATIAGTTYHIAFESSYNLDFTLSLQLLNGSVNDLFANRIILSGTNVTATGFAVNATDEQGEPAQNSYSIWWTWTAPMQGTVKLTVTSSPFTPVFSLYRGSGLGSLVKLQDNYYDRNIPIFFDVHAGETYQIAVSGSPSYATQLGEIVLHLEEKQVPPKIYQQPASVIGRIGDVAEFDVQTIGFGPITYQWQRNGVDLSGKTRSHLYLAPMTFDLQGTYNVNVSNGYGTTKSSNAVLVVLSPPSNDDFANALIIDGTDVRVKGSNVGATREYDSKSPQIGGSVWWVWTAPSDGNVTIDAGESSFSPFVTVYTGDSLSHLTFISDSGVNDGPFAMFRAVAGTTYRILVDNNYPRPGTIRLRLLENHLDAPEIVHQPIGTTVYPSEPVMLSVLAFSSGSMKFQWQLNGVNLAGATTDVLRIPRAKASDTGRYSVLVSAGNKVSRSIDAVVQLFSTDPEPAVNNNFAQAIAIGGLNVTTTGSTAGARSEYHEPIQFPDQSLWWKWTAPEDGLVVLNTFGSTVSAYLDIYTGDALTSVTPIGQPETREFTTFTATAGMQYYIRLATESSGNIVLHLAENDADRPPSVLAQPENKVAAIGETVTWTVPVYGAKPMRFQWQFNGLNIPGQTSNTLALPAVTRAQAGKYRLSIRNDIGRVASSVATLQVLAPVKISRPPISLVVYTNAMASMTVYATGSALAYQWQFHGGDLPNATNASLTLAHVSEANAGYYTVIVSNPVSTADASAMITLRASPLDLDGNGETDLLLRHRSNGQFSAWLMNGTNFSKFQLLGEPISLEWRFVGVNDFDGDGQKDLLLQGTNGVVSVVPVNGTNLLSSYVIDPSGVHLTADWKLEGVADLNHDGKVDLLARNVDGTVGIWLLDGTNFLTGTPIILSGTNLASNWRIAGLADFNDDAKVDILWQSDDGHLYVWLMDGTTYTDASYLLSGESIGENWNVVGLADLNRDGLTDLVLQSDKGMLTIKFLYKVEFLGGGLLRGGLPINPALRVIAPR